MDQLGTAHDRPRITRLLLAACRKLAHGWPARPPAENSDFVRKVVRRVLVHPDKLEVLVSKTELRAVLSKDGQTKILSAELNQVEEDVIRLEMPSTLKRCGSEVRLVVPPASGGEMAARLRPSLLKAMARAHDWYERVLAGTAHDITSLSRLVGLSEPLRQPGFPMRLSCTRYCRVDSGGTPASRPHLCQALRRVAIRVG